MSANDGITLRMYQLLRTPCYLAPEQPATPATEGLEAEVRALRELLERAERRALDQELARLTAAFDARRR